VSSTEAPVAAPFSVAPGEPEAGVVPAGDAPVDQSEELSPHDMELMKQSVIANWRLSRDKRSEKQAKSVAAQAEPASPPPGPAQDRASLAPVPPPPTAPQLPAQNAGPIPCSMLPATATPCLRQ
jgi:hypothetical protein